MTEKTNATFAQRQAVWTRHWATGATHSCAGSYAQTYGGTVADFWRGLHQATPPGARVLDIATGSGAIPRLLLQLRPTLDLHIDAVDVAPCPARWLNDLPGEQAARVHFHADVRAEALPFPDAHFDLVVSQYGIEYTDLDRAVPELLRVAAPKGRIGLVMHHADSRPAHLAAVEIAHIEWLRGPQGLVNACAMMLAPLARATTAEGRLRLEGDLLAEATRQRFNAAQDALGARAGSGDGADVLGEAQDAVAQIFTLLWQQGEGAARRACAQLDQALADSQWRLRELLDCALDANAAQALSSRLATRGLQAHLQPLQEGPHLLGWALQAG